MTKEELIAENRVLRELLQESEHKLQAIRDYIDYYENERSNKNEINKSNY